MSILIQILELPKPIPLTQSELAEKFGVSRQYINQLVRRYNIPVGSRVSKSTVDNKCRCCGESSGSRVFCSVACKASCRTGQELTCHYCKIKFYRRKSLAERIRDKAFCSLEHYTLYRKDNWSGKN